MEPASLIVGTLVRLLLPGTQAVVKQAMIDAYTALKSALVTKYGNAIASEISDLEQSPASPQVQQCLAAHLHAAGADQDREILMLTQQLSHLIEEGADAGLPSPVVAVQRRAAVHAVRQLMDGHLSRVAEARTQYRVEDTDLLTGKVVESKAMPHQIRDELGKLHTRIRSVIETIAQRIEDGEYRNAESAIADLRIGLIERDRAQRLIRADKELHVSYQTLRMAVEFFGEFNREILEKIERETDAARLATMMFGNAIMIYELTDFVISYIESFVVRGASEIEEIHTDECSRIAALRREHEQLVAEAEAPGIEPLVREQTLADVAARRGAIDLLENEWTSYVHEVRRFDGMIDEVRTKLPTLRLIRNNAKVQISTLQAVEQLRFLKQNSDAMRGTVAAIQGFRLAPLTPHRVRRLLNI